MAFTPREIIEIMTKARELGLSSLRLEGLDIAFQPGLQTLTPIVRAQQQAPLLRTGDADWHEQRRMGIGGSDAPTIMRTTPPDWSTPQKLWEEKTRRRQPDPPNYPMRRGIHLEPKARARYEDMTGIEMPRHYAVSSKYNFIRGNADGVNFKAAKGLEIKCPGRADHAVALAGKIPEKYIFQLVHLLYVLDLDEMDYFSFDGEDGKIVPFYRDKKLEKKLIPEERKFWEEHVVKDVPPDPPRPPTLKIVGGKKLVDPFRVRRNAGDR